MIRYAPGAPCSLLGQDTYTQDYTKTDLQVCMEVGKRISPPPGPTNSLRWRIRGVNEQKWQTMRIMGERNKKVSFCVVSKLAMRSLSMYFRMQPPGTHNSVQFYRGVNRRNPKNWTLRGGANGDSGSGPRLRRDRKGSIGNNADVRLVWLQLRPVLKNIAKFPIQSN